MRWRKKWSDQQWDDAARLVARDVVRRLEARAPSLKDVYGVVLWTDDYYGYFVLSVATESQFDEARRLPAYANQPDEALRAPTGLRWDVGSWMSPDEDDFVAPDTTAALAPFVAELQSDDIDDEALCALSERWVEMASAALAYARPLEHVPTAEDAVAFVQAAGMTPLDTAERMVHSVPADRFHRVFPAWRRFAASLRAPQPDFAELTKNASFIGLHMTDVTGATDSLKRALAVAGGA